LATLPLQVSPSPSDTVNDVPLTDPVSVNVAPLTNVIVMDALAPLRTRTGGLAWRVSTARSDASALDPAVVVIAAVKDPRATGLAIAPT
jgi:hypothetical protein